MSGMRRGGCAPKSLETMICVIQSMGGEASIDEVYQGACVVASVIQCVVTEDFSTRQPRIFADYANIGMNNGKTY